MLRSAVVRRYHANPKETDDVGNEHRESTGAVCGGARPAPPALSLTRATDVVGMTRGDERCEGVRKPCAAVGGSATSARAGHPPAVVLDAEGRNGTGLHGIACACPLAETGGVLPLQARNKPSCHSRQSRVSPLAGCAIHLRFAHPVFHPMMCSFKGLFACVTRRATRHVPPDPCDERV
jgi:hypothetical protein